MHGFLALEKLLAILSSQRRLKGGLSPPSCRWTSVCGETESCSMFTQGICTREGDVSHHCFSTEIKLPFHSISNPEEISQDLRSADCTGLHETVLPVLEERPPEYRNVMYSPYPPTISLKLEYACLPTWKSQRFTPHLTPAFNFFPPFLIPFKFIAYRERLRARDTNQVPRLGRQWSHLENGSNMLLYNRPSSGWIHLGDRLSQSLFMQMLMEQLNSCQGHRGS